MQGNNSSTDDSFSLPADTTTTPASLENHSDDVFAVELRDLELRLEQLELEQRSLRIQLQRARLRSAERNTAPPPRTRQNGTPRISSLLHKRRRRNTAPHKQVIA